MTDSLSLFTLTILYLGHGDWIRDLAKSVGLGICWNRNGGGTDRLVRVDKLLIAALVYSVHI